MAQLKDLLVNGPSRFIGDVFINSLSILDTFKVGPNGKYFQAGSQGITLGDGSAAAANPENLITINGHVVINADKNTTNGYNEGLRINNGSANWSCVALGGDSNTLSGTSKSVWIMATQRHDTTNKVSNLYIANNGSSGVDTLRLTGHATNAQPTLGFSIRPRLSIGRDPDVNYTLLVGTSDATTNNISVFNGRAVINPSYTSETSNTYCYGLRINRTGGNNGGKSQVVLGGTQGSLSGAPVGVWTLGVENNPADATSTATKTAFYIAHQGVGGFNPDSNAYIRGTYGTDTSPVTNKLEIMFPETYASNLYPNADNTYNLGSSSNKWKSIFADRFTGASGQVDYLTCGTGASTATKVVTLANYILNVGSSIYIKFTEQNTANEPKLNINNTGAKAIYYKNTQVLSYGLKSNFIYHMIYDGTYWQIVNDLDNFIPSGICDTANNQITKSANIPGFIRYPGAKVNITFTYGSQTSSSCTLDVNKYGSKVLYWNGVQNTTSLAENSVYQLQWDGTYWQILDVKLLPVITCDTLAGTGCKDITYPGYVQFIGSRVKVIFSNQNTSTSLTFRVNSSTSSNAKQIWYKGVRVNGAALLANYEYELEWDGTYWQIKNEYIPSTIGTCSTSGGTTVKVISCPGYIPYDGATIKILFSSNNSIGSIQFKINENSNANVSVYEKEVGKYDFEKNYIYEFVYDKGLNTYKLINFALEYARTFGVTAQDAVVDSTTGDIITPAVAEVSGTEILTLGNLTRSTNDGGMTGILKFYGPGQGGNIQLQSATDQIAGTNNAYLPKIDGNGYLIYKSETTAVGGDNRPIYINANGKVTAITYEANRLYYPVTTASFNKGTHYVNDTKIAISSTSEPTENFYVNGTAKISGAITLSGNITTAITANSAVVTDANKKLTARTITNNTTATAATTSTNLITENTLYNHTGNSNITTVGTISSGTWQGTKIGTAYGGTGHTANYNAKGIIFATSATEFSSTAAGSSGQVLTSQGGGTKDPTWTSQSSLSVGTSASCSGNAATATTAGKWTSAQTVYVTLGTASTTTTLQGGSSTAQTIGVNGTLAIGNGGTGLTASPSMLTNLGSTTAANVLQASPRPGVTGTLAIGNGGTGLTSSPSMLTNLGSTTAANVLQASPRPGITGTLGLGNGGTNATTAAGARTNLGLGTMATESKDNYILKSVLSGAYDIMYSSAANTPTRLAANTAATKKFLTMTGTGSAGAAPTWGTLTTSDIPDHFIRNDEDDVTLGNLSIEKIDASSAVFTVQTNADATLTDKNISIYMKNSEIGSGIYSGLRTAWNNTNKTFYFSIISNQSNENTDIFATTTNHSLLTINCRNGYTTFAGGASFAENVTMSKNLTMTGILYAQNGLVIPTSAKANTTNGAIWIA